MTFARGLFLGVVLAGFFAVSTISAQAQILPFDPERYPGASVNVVGVQAGSQGIVEVVRNLFTTIKPLLAPILVFFIGGLGINMIIARGDEAKYTAAANNFFYILAGTAFFLLADFLSQTFSIYQQTGNTVTTFISGKEEILSTTTKLQAQLQILVKLIRYSLGGIALFYVVKSGTLIMFNADEETAGQQKDAFQYGFIGFIIIIVSEAIVNAVFNIQTLENVSFGNFFVAAGVNVSGGIGVLTNVTNLFLAAIGSLSLFTLVIGGAMYAFSAGSEERGEKATKLIIGAIMGLVISFSSYTLVAEFSAGGNILPTAPEGQVPLVQPSPAPASNP